MPASINLIDQRFNRLTVIRRTKQRKRGSVVWACRCDCGRLTYGTTAALNVGYKQSCGCLHLDMARNRFTVHGGSRTRLYYCWYAMRQRCSYKKHKAFPRYGGRGIKVCREWQTFEPFRRWAMNNGYEEGLTIDRIDNDGDYEPANCRWITRSENVRRALKVRWG